MPCTPGIRIPKPTLAPPLSFTPPDPGTIGIDANLKFCCQLPPVSLHTPPIPLPTAVLNPALVEGWNAFIDQVIALLNSFPFECPLE